MIMGWSSYREDPITGLIYVRAAVPRAGAGGGGVHRGGGGGAVHRGRRGHAVVEGAGGHLRLQLLVLEREGGRLQRGCWCGLHRRERRRVQGARWCEGCCRLAIIITITYTG